MTTKKKLNLIDLKQNEAQEMCSSTSNEVNNFTSKMGSKKVNKAKPCLDKCKVTNPNLPIISSPFEAYKLNTANNGINAHLNSGLDTTWEAGEGTATSNISSVSTWAPAFIYHHSAWTPSPFGNANWISIYQNARHKGNKNIYFKTKFLLSDIVDPSNFKLNMDFYADNAVQEIFVNGISQSGYGTVLPQSSSPYSHRGFDSGKQVSISLENDWKHCENEIVVHVKSGPSYIGFLAQNSAMCLEADIPKLSPVIELLWGDSNCDCIETDDYEVFYIAVRNPYNNVNFSNFRIGKIRVVDKKGKLVAVLPDGTDSVELVPVGPYCFGNIDACSSKRDNSVFRQFVLNNRGAKSGDYKILLEGICFEVSTAYSQKQCLAIDLCAS